MYEGAYVRNDKNLNSKRKNSLLPLPKHRLPCRYILCDQCVSPKR